MANRDIIVFDFETGGRNPHTCQPTQIAAIALDGRNFKLKGKFNSEIRAVVDDEKAIAAGLGPIEEDALKVTGKTREGIAKAPQLKTVWKKFCAFVDKYNWKGTPFFAPIPAGFNIIGYDMHIINRLCEQFGPWDDKRGQQKLFSMVYKIDVMDNVWMWMENNADVKSLSMDSMRDLFGMSKENAHDALQDVKDTANLMIGFMKLHRRIAPKIKFEKAFADGNLHI